MCCIFTAFVFFGPRFGILLWWLADPLRFALVFGDNWVLPLLCFIFLPWTLLMYVLLAPLAGVDIDAALPATGIQGFDWIWMALAFLADMGSYFGGAYGNRRQIYGYVPAAQPGQTNYYGPYYGQQPPAAPPASPPDNKPEV
jgi:hypothetical protein